MGVEDYGVKESIKVIDQIPVSLYNKTSIGMRKYSPTIKGTKDIEYLKRLISDYLRGEHFVLHRLTEIRGNMEHTIKAEIGSSKRSSLVLYKQLDFLIMPKYMKEIKEILSFYFPEHKVEKFHTGFDENEFSQMPTLYAEITTGKKKLLVRLEKDYFNEENIQKILTKRSEV